MSSAPRPVAHGSVGERSVGERRAPRPLDAIDRRILRALQERGDMPLAELAHRAGLSQTPCWKRVQKLEEAGVITRRVALIAPERVGLDLTVIVTIEAEAHSADWLARFSSHVARYPEVVEVLRMAGDVDYVLKVIVPDMASYDGFYQDLIAHVPFKNVTSRFVMERIKSTTQLAIPEPGELPSWEKRAASTPAR